MGDHLSEDQFAALADQLRLLQAELQRALQQGDETAPVDLDLPIGRLTRMDAIQQQSMAKANRRDNEMRLQQVRRALEAVDEGEYGSCRKCRRAINYQRLNARPEAAICLRCQEALESGRH